MAVESLINLYDTEWDQIAKNVLVPLNAKQRTRVDLEGFRKEVIERFGIAGYQVTVVAKQDPDDPNLFGWDITLVDRIQTGEFDHDRQRYEVQHDVVGLGTPGMIGNNGVIMEPSKTTGYVPPKS